MEYLDEIEELDLDGEIDVNSCIPLIGYEYNNPVNTIEDFFEFLDWWDAIMDSTSS